MSNYLWLLTSFDRRLGNNCSGTINRSQLAGLVDETAVVEQTIKISMGTKPQFWVDTLVKYWTSYLDRVASILWGPKLSGKGTTCHGFLQLFGSVLNAHQPPALPLNPWFPTSPKKLNKACKHLEKSNAPMSQNQDLPSGKLTVCYWKWPSRTSEFLHSQWWLSMVMLVYQRVVT